MTTLARARGLFISTRGLREVEGNPGSHHEIIAVDSTGCPAPLHTERFRPRRQPKAEAPRLAYPAFLPSFFGHILRRGAMWNHESEYMCLPVEEFSREEETGQAARDQDVDSDRVKLADESPTSRTPFVPIRDFYSMTHKARLSAYANRMHSKLLCYCKRVCLGQVASTGNLERADIRRANRLEAWWYPTAYFGHMETPTWRATPARGPKPILKRMRQTIAALIVQACTQRGPALQLLNEMGKRVSVILGLTAGGYREALIANKGSLERREEKTFHCTSTIESPFLQPIRTEYSPFDPHECKRPEESAEEKFYHVSHSKWCGGRS